MTRPRAQASKQIIQMFDKPEFEVPPHVQAVLTSPRHDGLEGFDKHWLLARTPTLISMYCDWYRSHFLLIVLGQDRV